MVYQNKFSLGEKAYDTQALQDMHEYKTMELPNR